MRFYRAVFGLAALYNIAFGLWTGLFPLHFFSLFELTPPHYPSLWACLGMVVGLYGLVYAYVAWKPAQGDFLIAVGLLGKLLGPIGWVMTVHNGELPARTFPLILANDLVWWFPFLFYLLRKNKRRGLMIAWLIAVIHGFASLGLLAVHPGNEFTDDMNARRIWVASNADLWSAVWIFWVLSSTGFIAFSRVWMAPLLRFASYRAWIWAAFWVGAAGVPFDLAGEVVNIVWLTDAGRTLEEFARGAQAYLWLSAATANGLYCVAGLVLSGISWRTGFLRSWAGGLGFSAWIAGVFMTVLTLMSHRVGILASGSLTMAFFIPWVVIVGWKLRK